MLESVLGTVVEVTLASSVAILLLLTMKNALDRNFTAKWRYWVWLIIAIRLVLPLNLTIESPPIQLPIAEINNGLTLMTPEQPSNFQNTSTSEAFMGLNDDRMSGPAMTTQPSNDKDDHLMNVLPMIWIAGTLLFLLWQMFSYALFLRKIKSDSTAVRQQEMISPFENICSEMKIKRKIPLMVSKLVRSPMVLGIWRQKLLLPDMVFTTQQLNMIYRHELIHIQRHDILYKTFILLARAFHWFNPLVHLMAIEANKDVEASCDAAVVASQDIDFRKDYGKAILLIIHNSRSSQVVFSTHFGGGKVMIMKRLENLFDMRKKKKGIIPFIVLILVIGIVGLCVSCSQNTTTTSTPVVTTVTTTTAPATATTKAAETTAGLDPKLLGKWVEEVPADIVGLPLDSIEFFTDGTALIADVDHGAYKIINGILQCTFYGTVYSGKYEMNGTKLTIYKDSGESKAYIKSESAAGLDPKLLGKWVEEVPADIEGLPLDSIEFYADGTALIADVDHGTYKIVNGKLQCTFYAVTYTGKYEISGTKLTIYKDSGESKVYIKK